MGWYSWRYSLYAPFYDAAVAAVLRGPRRRALEALDVRPGERVLLSGVGTGLDLEFLGPGSLAATDLSPAMIRRALARARSCGVEIQVAVADAQRLPFADGAFDAVVLHLILTIVPDPAACLAEAVRVLRPAGRISILDKFLGAREPALLRRAANAVTSVLATDINRRLEPLLAGAGLVATRDEPVLLGDLFRAVLARPVNKQGSASAGSARS